MKPISNQTEQSLANRIEMLIAEARKQVITTVNTTMVYTYYEIGRMIVEDEQQGERRAEYGKAVLKELSMRLTLKFGKGFSVENLDRMRYFYKIYSTQISSTVLTKSLKRQDKPNKLHFTLSWSHYLKLMRISNPEERRFYEIEAINRKSI